MVHSGANMFYEPQELNPCVAEWINLSHPLVTVNQSDHLMQISLQIQNLNVKQKPSDLALHCLQDKSKPTPARQGLIMLTGKCSLGRLGSAWASD